MQNPFDNAAFDLTSMTAAINLPPNRYGRMEELGLFPAKPVRTRTIVVEEKAGVLNLLLSLPPGAPGTVGPAASAPCGPSSSPTVTWSCPRRSRGCAPSAPRTSTSPSPRCSPSTWRACATSTRLCLST